MKLEFDISRNCFYPKDDKELAELSFSSNSLSKNEIEERVCFILKHIETLPEALTLLKKVLTKGPIKVEFCKHETMTSSAKWNGSTRTITIANEGLEHELLDSFIWELCNADNIELEKVTPSSCKSAKEFADATENGEYFTHVKTVELMGMGYSKYGWAKNKEKNPFRQSQTLEEYLASAQIPSLTHHGFSHFGVYLHSYLEWQERKLKLEDCTIQLEISNLNIQLCRGPESRLSEDAVIASSYFYLRKPMRSAQAIAEDKSYIIAQKEIIKQHEKRSELLQRQIKEVSIQIKDMKDNASSEKVKLVALETKFKTEIKKRAEEVKKLKEQVLKDGIMKEYLNKSTAFFALIGKAFEMQKVASSNKYEALLQLFELAKTQIEQPEKQDFNNLKTWIQRCNTIIEEIEFERDNSCGTKLLTWFCCYVKPPTQQQQITISDEIFEPKPVAMP